MKVNRYLDFIEDAKTIELLRFFVLSPREHTGREVARLAGLNHKTCRKYLESLCNHNVLAKKAIGRSYVYTFLDNYLTRVVIIPLIKQENDILNTIKADIICFTKFCKAVVFFVPKAENTEYGLIFMVKSVNKDIECQIADVLSHLQTRYCISVKHELVTLWQLLKKQLPELLTNSLDDGEWLMGSKEEIKKMADL